LDHSIPADAPIHMTPHLLILNPNTTEAVTDRLAAAAHASARTGTRISATQPSWGVSSVEGYYDGYVSVTAALARIHELRAAGHTWDAVIWAGFGDVGGEALRELLDIPVITIAEAAVHLALMLGHRYAIVTTLRRCAPMITDVLTTSGLMAHCAGVFGTDLEVLAEPEALRRRLGEVAGQALESGAEVICLGSAAMTGWSTDLSADLGVPVVDGVTAAVAMAESLVGLGLRTSKINAYATPRGKVRPGWPSTST
jgi:allantoin racemase